MRESKVRLTKDTFRRQMCATERASSAGNPYIYQSEQFAANIPRKL